MITATKQLFNVSAQTVGQRGGAMAVTLEGKGLLGRTEKATAAAVVLMRCATSIGSGISILVPQLVTLFGEV